MTAVMILGSILYWLFALALICVAPIYFFARGMASGTLEPASRAPWVISGIGVAMIVAFFW